MSEKKHSHVTILTYLLLFYLNQKYRHSCQHFEFVSFKCVYVSNIHSHELTSY